VVINTANYSLEDAEVHGFDPMAAPSLRAWGYETSWGSFAQFTRVQAHQLLPRPRHLSWEEAACYGLTYFTAYRMLLNRGGLRAGHRVLIWGAAGGLGVFATQLCRLAKARCVGVVSSDQKAALIELLGAGGAVNRRQFPDLGCDDADRHATASGAFAGRVIELLGGPADIVFEHVGSAAILPSMMALAPLGRVVTCGATSGYDLCVDIRDLALHGKRIVGSHGANLWETNRANELVKDGKIRPVLWRSMEFDQVPEAHQILLKNEHLGKIAILVGADREGLGRDVAGPRAIRVEDELGLDLA
jgi:crotonyl-CoA carboxylase/reductase